MFVFVCVIAVSKVIIVIFNNVGTWWNWGYDNSATITPKGEFKKYLDDVYNTCLDMIYMENVTQQNIAKMNKWLKQTVVISPTESAYRHGFVSCKFGSCHYSTGQSMPVWTGTFGRYDPQRSAKAFAMTYNGSVLSIRSI